MAACVAFNAQGVLTLINGVSATDCTSYLLLDAAEYQTSTAQLNLTLTQLASIPSATDFATAWSAGFTIPMAIGLIAWAVAKLVNFWRTS